MNLEQVAENERFLNILAWSLALQKRYDDLLHVGLIQIEYNASEVMDSCFGAMDAVNKLREITVCLQQCFRDTDAIARFGTTFWVLVPMTQDEPVTAKVQTVIQTAKSGGLDIEHTHVHVHKLVDHSPWLKQMGCDSNQFLAYLEALEPESAHLPSLVN
jgi:hypothetical protein